VPKVKTYLVLGGSSFIGGFLIAALCKTGRVITTVRPDKQTETFEKSVKVMPLDFVNTVNFRPYLQGIDTVIHLISTVVPEPGTERAADDLRQNLLPTIRLLDAMAQCGTRKIIFISSGGTVYGEQGEEALDEAHPTLPICSYGICKLTIEKYLHLYHVNHGLDYRAVRLSNVYGARAKAGQTQGLIPIIIDDILCAKPISIWGSGEKIRDYIHISDVVDAVLRIDGYRGGERIFNVGSGIGQTVHDVVNTIAEILDCRDFDVHYTRGRLCDVESNVLDIGLMERCTGWRPRISLEEGVRLLVTQQMLARKAAAEKKI
jgi:Nucleoside-diphosphate-sugar epimerases